MPVALETLDKLLLLFIALSAGVALLWHLLDPRFVRALCGATMLSVLLAGAVLLYHRGPAELLLTGAFVAAALALAAAVLIGLPFALARRRRR